MITHYDALDYDDLVSLEAGLERVIVRCGLWGWLSQDRKDSSIHYLSSVLGALPVFGPGSISGDWNRVTCLWCLAGSQQEK